MKITVTAPTRISLIGGGTDLPIFYNKHGGAVVSMAINLRQTMEIEQKKDTWFLSMPENGSPAFYQAFVDEFPGFYSIKANSDAPIQSGLGSSASAAVALVAGLSKLAKFKLTKQEIVDKAWDIEVNKLKMYGGKQDQIAACFGGFNYIEFAKETDKWDEAHRGFVAVPYSRALGDFWSERILLFFTGVTRKNPKIQEKLKYLNKNQIRILDNMKSSAIEAHVLIQEKAFDILASLLNDMWEGKKKLNPLVTSSQIDNIYSKALRAGASAGKLLGSGGGGCMAFLVEPKKQERVIRELETIKGVKHYEFSIDWNGVEVRSNI